MHSAFTSFASTPRLSPSACGCRAVAVAAAAVAPTLITAKTPALHPPPCGLSAKKPAEALKHRQQAEIVPALGRRWREYHGCDRWRGMLDPLDDKLRQEIVKYGEFVQATYSAMDFDPRSDNYGCCRYPEADLLQAVGLQGCGYRVTKNIVATSGTEVPTWMKQGKWKRLLRRSSWMGFVAVCDDEENLKRLGRRDIVVAYRGTVTPLEWLDNLKTALTTVVPPAVKVQKGFWSVYTTRGPPEEQEEGSVADQVVGEICRLARKYRRSPHALSVTITGHSLGAALALLSAPDVRRALRRTEGCADVPVSVVTFGGPRVGNPAFSRSVEDAANVLRVVNVQDVITKLPGFFLNETTVGQLLPPARLVMPWTYSHVGTELRLDSRHCPYLRPDADMNCCHDLEAYLHLVEGFLSSQCPFRSCAKRDILRLLINQKSNVLHDLYANVQSPSPPAPSTMNRSPTICV